MRIKGSPSDPTWYGQGGNSLTKGFVVLPMLPQKAPPLVKPSDSSLVSAHIAALNGKSVKETCVKFGFEESHEWLINFAKSGRIPVRGVPDDYKVPDIPQMKGWDFYDCFGTSTHYYPIYSESH